MKTDISMIAAACLGMMSFSVVVGILIRISVRINLQCCHQYQSAVRPVPTCEQN